MTTRARKPTGTGLVWIGVIDLGRNFTNEVVRASIIAVICGRKGNDLHH